MRVNPEPLGRLMRLALAQRGVPEQHMELLVDALLQTSLRGTDTHGVRLFETYLKELDNGRSHPNPRITTTHPYPAVCAVDANHALGIVAGCTATNAVIAKAADLGISTAIVRNSNHFGAAAIYTLQMARAGCIGIALSNADALVAPINSGTPLMGTNPISIAVPNLDGEPLCLDMATSQISFSRLMLQLGAGSHIPSGWAVDETGADLSEGNGEFAALRPLGGYKGQGLGLMIALLCSILADSPFDCELSHLYKPPYDTPRQVSHLFIGLHIAQLNDRDSVAKRLQTILHRIRSWPTVDGQPVVVPGDLECRTVQDRSTNGIPLNDAEWAYFVGLARQHGITLAE